MQYKSNKGFTGFGQLGILIMCVGVGLLIGGLIQSMMAAQLIPSQTPKADAPSMILKALKDPQNSNIIRWMQILSTFFIFCIPAVIYSLICNGKKLIWLGFSKYINVFQIMIGFLIIFTANILAGPLQDFTEKIVAHMPTVDAFAKSMEKSYSENIKAMMSNLHGGADLIVSLIILALLPALFEELFFRGALQNIFIKWWKKPLLAILISSLIFSLIHGSIYLFLSRLVLGLALGFMYYETKNIWVNIIAHFLNNAIAVGQFFALSKSNDTINVSEMDVHMPWWIGAIAAGVVIFLCKLLSKYSQENKMRIYSREQALMVNYPTGNPLA